MRESSTQRDKSCGAPRSHRREDGLAAVQREMWKRDLERRRQQGGITFLSPYFQRGAQEAQEAQEVTSCASCASLLCFLCSVPVLLPEIILPGPHMVSLVLRSDLNAMPLAVLQIVRRVITDAVLIP